MVFAYHNVGARCLRVLLAHGVDVALVVTHADNPAENIWFESVAEVARDSLRAPSLAASLWLQLEQGWPASPYVPKALMARMAILPDSAETLRGRLVAMTASPYLAYARGENDPRFAQLEDSLATFITARARRLAAAAAAAQVDKE